MTDTPRVVIGYISGGHPTLEFTASLAATVRHCQQVVDTIPLRSSPRIAEARSQIVDLFAGKDADWLLMIDDDMQWTPADVKLLLSVASRDERPIVGGLCFSHDAASGPYAVRPTLWRVTDRSGTVELIRDYPKGELVEVDSTGAAFLLVHRQVFAKMRAKFGKLPSGADNPYPYFVEGLVTGAGVALGEDSAFCARARSMGIPIFVHTGARIGHVKTVVLTEAMFEG